VVNVLYINHVSQISGAEMSLLGMLKHLNRDRYFPIVVCPPGGCLPRELSRLNVTTVTMNICRFRKAAGAFTLCGYACRYGSAVWKLRRIVKRHRIQLVHSNSTTAQVYGSLVARLCGIPSAWHARDLVALGFLGRTLYSLSSVIIVPSKAVGAAIDAYGDGPKAGRSAAAEPADGTAGPYADGKVRVIRNGIDIEDWVDGPSDKNCGGSRGEELLPVRQEFGIDPDVPLIGMVGQFVSWKRHAVFIDGIYLAAKDVPNIRALVVGDDLFGDHPRYKEELTDHCRNLGVEDRISFTGYRRDIRRVMAAIDVLVLPSRNEPFGRVILEAMATGRPVIATDVGGPPEVVRGGETGLLIPADEPQRLAEALVHLIKDPELRTRMGSAGRQRVRECFDVRSTVSMVEKVYDELSGRT
jgi:glycosyltransferase involved in cell wall biosynthesis